MNEIENDVKGKLKYLEFGAGVVRLLCPYTLEYGKIYKRAEIISKIDAKYKDITGKDVPKGKRTSAVRRVVEKGKLFKRPDTKSYYQYKGKLLKKPETKGYYQYIGEQAEEFQSPPDEVSDNTPLDDLQSEKIINVDEGGDFHVYVWTLPSYKKHPDENGEYPIKIGHTSEGLTKRLDNSIRDLPETPVYLLQFCCSTLKEARALEKFFHAIFAKRKAPSSRGSEWFQITPEEIEKVYEEHYLRKSDSYAR